MKHEQMNQQLSMLAVTKLVLHEENAIRQSRGNLQLSDNGWRVCNQPINHFVSHIFIIKPECAEHKIGKPYKATTIIKFQSIQTCLTLSITH